MNTFWISFIITEAVGVAQAFISLSNLQPGVKAALENFITAGTALVNAIQLSSGKVGVAEKQA